MTGLSHIALERARQIIEEGYTLDTDAKLIRGELAYAAAIYALPTYMRSPALRAAIWPDGWLLKETPDDRIKELAKAGALIAAEIDRLLRK